jgi:hypothetical protein
MKERLQMKSDIERKTDKPTSGIADLVLDGRERGNVNYWFHDEFAQVVLTINGMHVHGSEATVHIGRMAYRLAYTGALGNWKMLDRFVS